MTPRTEQANPAVKSAKCLQALEDFLPIVEHRSGGIEAEVVVWLDAAVDPALSGVIVLQEHMVGKDCAELEGCVVSSRLR